MDSLFSFLGSLFGNSQDEMMMQNKYSADGSNADAGLADTAKSVPSNMDNLKSFGNEQLSQFTNPYTQGLSGVQNIYNQFKNGNGLLGTDSANNPSALSSLSSLLSDKGILGGDSNVSLNVQSQPMSLGMPNISVQSAPQFNNPDPKRSRLAQQAYGQYY
jgi:hypothetical protein